MVGYFKRKLMYRSANVNNQQANSLLFVIDNFDFKLNEEFNKKYLKNFSRFGTRLLLWYTNNKDICNEIDFLFKDTYALSKLAQTTNTYAFEKDGYMYVLNADFFKNVIYNAMYDNYAYIILVKCFDFINDDNFISRLFFHLDLLIDQPTKRSLEELDVQKFLQYTHLQTEQLKQEIKTIWKDKNWNQTKNEQLKQDQYQELNGNNISTQIINTDFWLVYFSNGKKKQQNIEYTYYKAKITNKSLTLFFKYFLSFSIMSLCENISSVYSENLLNEMYKIHYHKHKLIN